MIRVYVPATLADLAEWVAAGEVPAAADWVVPGGADEEEEYAALMAAADASAVRLAGPGRRVVVVGETADASTAVAWADVQAVHADPEDRPEDADPDEDLAWYAAQEATDLLA